MFYYAELGRSVLKGVGMNTGEPQNWGALEFRCLEMAGVADHKIHAFTHVCYHVRFGTSAKGCTHK